MGTARQLQLTPKTEHTLTPRGGFVAEFLDIVRKQKDMLGMTPTQLAAATGLSRTYIYQILDGSTNVTLDTAEKLAKALQFEIRVKKLGKIS